MAIFTDNPSPLFDANADGDMFAPYAGANTIDTSPITIQMGSEQKGTAQKSMWIMFELDIPRDSIINNVSLFLYVVSYNAIQGQNVEYTMGWLAPDGTWDVQASEDGWKEYTAFSDDLPHPTSTTDAAWYNSEVSFDDTIEVDDVVPDDTITWAGSGGDRNAANFTTNLQSLFDENESNRTFRGVPVALLFRCVDVSFNQYNFASANRAPAQAERRPLITVDYTPPTKTHVFMSRRNTV